MNKREIMAFITKLRRARAAVVRGDTGCVAAPGKCWSCAMRKRSSSPGKTFYHYTGPPADWSFDRPKSDTLAMFDNSIAALETELLK